MLKKRSAICHSLYEIIERNCLYDFGCLRLLEKNKLAIDITDIDYPHACHILEKYLSLIMVLKNINP